jgi:AraC-like DNA-binding protein
MTTNLTIAQAVLALTPQAGYFPTDIPGVMLMRADRSSPPVPVLQEPTIVVLAQGMKRGYLGDEVMTYKSEQCLLVAVPMHFNCDTVVEKGNPMLAITVTVDMDITRELLAKMRPSNAAGQEVSHRGMVVTDLDESSVATLVRLLKALACPEEAKIMGQQLVRELHYRILKSPGGEIFRSIVTWQGKSGAIYRACERIQVDYAQDLDVGTLAGEAAMSTSAFHQAFKAVTGNSPIQYIKATRLQRSHELIKLGNLGVAETAYQVGYASTSQFSREFKRMFGYSPVDAKITAPIALAV